MLHAPLCVDRLARDRIVDIDHPDFARAEFIARSATRITAPPSTAAGNRAFCRLHRQALGAAHRAASISSRRTKRIAALRPAGTFTRSLFWQRSAACPSRSLSLQTRSPHVDVRPMRLARHDERLSSA
ncbi:hypothetical protein, partial [Burkholderia sp. AU12872]|uniref:hypothetical protein n=1 Tax=Burkholderia sp. AU12872 TaxID=2171707 RepID=UPI001A9C9581